LPVGPTQDKGETTEVRGAPRTDHNVTSMKRHHEAAIVGADGHSCGPVGRGHTDTPWTARYGGSGLGRGPSFDTGCETGRDEYGVV
jgi:hypothetical protein